MRCALMVGALLIGGALGSVQIASMAIYGDLAQRPSIPALLPPSIGFALMRPLKSSRAPVFLRIAYAQALLHRGDAAAARTIVAGLPETKAAADLRGKLAELAGRPDQAVQEYAVAGDLERAQALIDARVTAGDLASAGRFERHFADVLTGDERAAVRARALWRLGQITELQAQADPGARLVFERRSLELYEEALLIAPNEETYLLAAGYQSLTVGDSVRALRYYSRALEVVPDSADARAGLLRARS